jgi:hypothetical protein
LVNQYSALILTYLILIWSPTFSIILLNAHEVFLFSNCVVVAFMGLLPILWIVSSRIQVLESLQQAAVQELLSLLYP